MHAEGGIWASDPTKRAAADARRRPRGHWDCQQPVPYFTKDTVLLYYKDQPVNDVAADNLGLLWDVRNITSCVVGM
jgi:hypothetical protein